MPYNYIKVSSNKITKATPNGYIIKELQKVSTWDTYTSDKYTDRGVNDITINKSPRVYNNPFDIFILEKSATAYEGNTPIPNALNIITMWDNRFPETIRLKYPGIITNNNFSERRKLNDENTYTFKIWENRSNTILDSAKVIPNDTLPTIIPQTEYFHELQTFIKLDNSSSYEEWLRRPSFSLRNILSKGIHTDGKLYQLYKVNDVNVQSLSSGFDEYIPWCFDQNGTKIDQYKVATIISYNKKEMYILLEFREEDIITIDENNVEIPILTNIIFWRSGISDSNITMDIRNKDQMLLLKDSNVSNISEYFKESKINTNTLVNFQKDRLENEILDDTPIDNDDTDNNRYILEYNSDPYFSIEKAKTSSRRIIFGRNADTELNVSMGGDLFTDHSKNKVHIFVDGNLLTNDEFYIDGGNIISSLSVANGYIEIFINQYTSNSYSFTLSTPVSSLTQDQLSYILYNNGFLWKTSYDKEYIIFNKTENACALVNGALVTTGNYLIIHSLSFNLNDSTTPIPTSVVNTTNLITDISDARDYNINYDPMLFETSNNNGSGNIKDKDLWLFDNTKNLINMRTNEPYFIIDTDKIQVMNNPDNNLTLVADQNIIDLRASLISGNIHGEIISETERSYLKEHYTQMSTVNRNILNMFLHSGVNSWSTLNANTEMTINKDYMIIRYTGTDDFPLLTIHKSGVYEYDGTLNSVQVKVKPAKITYNYFVLHRSDDNFADLYTYSFNKQVSYIMI